MKIVQLPVETILHHHRNRMLSKVNKNQLLLVNTNFHNNDNMCHTK